MTEKTTNDDKTLRRKIHQTIKKVTDDIERGFHFNTAIASIMELVNEIYARSASSEAVKTVVILLSPFVPHIAEELWEKLGNKTSIFNENWPSYDERLIIEDLLTIPVQINGKLRSKINVTRDASEEALKTKILADDKIKKYIGDMNPKFIIIPNKLVNIVIPKS